MECKMHLDDVYFKKVNDGTKSIEIRLNDEKRSKLKIGDIITFTNRKNSKKISVIITDIKTYDNFEELYRHTDKIKMGYKEEDIASPADMNLYYSLDKIDKYGVISIEFKKED